MDSLDFRMNRFARIPQEVRDAILGCKGRMTQKECAALFNVTPRAIRDVWGARVKKHRNPFMQDESDGWPEPWPEGRPPDLDPDNPPPWRCRCGRLVQGAIECACGTQTQWWRLDQAVVAAARKVFDEYHDSNDPEQPAPVADPAPAPDPAPASGASGGWCAGGVHGRGTGADLRGAGEAAPPTDPATDRERDTDPSQGTGDDATDPPVPVAGHDTGRWPVQEVGGA